MLYTIEPRQGKSYDVIVCGAGTAGVAAALAAARQGVSVLLLERSFSVGGMLTEGNAGITKFTEHCKDPQQYKTEVLDVLASDPRSVQVAGGIARELCLRLIASGGAAGTHGDCGSYVFTDRYALQALLLQLLEQAGVQILYDSRVCLVNRQDGCLKSVVAVNKEGFTEFAAKCFVDATGDADIAVLAGAEYVLGADEEDLAEGGARAVGQMQPMGCMYRAEGIDYPRLFAWFEENPGFAMQSCGLMDFENVKESYRKGDMCVFCVPIDNPDPATAQQKPQVLVQIYITPSRTGAVLLSFGPTHTAYTGSGVDAAQLSAGHTAMVHGALAITELLRKNYPGFENVRVTHIPDIGVRETRHIRGVYKMTALDVISGREFADSIGCGGHHIDTDTVPDAVRRMSMEHWRFHIPYRIMLAAGIRGLLVAGRAVSATRLASGALRTTVSCMQMGEAAGTAAAMAAMQGISPEELDVQALRAVLAENGAVL